MGDVDGRDAELLLQRTDLGPHLDPDLGVQVRERLIEEQDVGVQDEGAGQRHALLLAAGELAGVAIGQPREIHLAQALGQPARDLPGRQLAQLETVRDVRGHRHVRPQCVVLEHHADVARVRREPVDPALAEPDLTAVGPVEAGDESQQCRLAAPRRAEQCEELTVADVQRGLIDSGGGPELLGDRAQPDLYCRGLREPGSLCRWPVRGAKWLRPYLSFIESKKIKI